MVAGRAARSPRSRTSRRRCPSCARRSSASSATRRRPVSVVGASRIGGELFEHGDMGPLSAAVRELNLFFGIFNLFPLLPLDGGHIAIAWFERVRSWASAKLGKPDPGRVDYYKLMPLTLGVICILGVFVLLTVTADIREPDHPQISKLTFHHRETGGASMTAGSLGLPPSQPPALAPRRQVTPDHGRLGAGRRRRAGVRAVDDDDAHRRRQRHAPADRRAHRLGLPDRAGRRAQPGRRRGAAGDRAEVADPGDRRHPLPAEVRVRRDRRRLRGGPGQPRQHPAVRRQGQGDRQGGLGARACRSASASTPARSTSACWRSTARRRPRRWSSRRCGSARCSRSTTSATSRSRSSTTTRSS